MISKKMRNISMVCLSLVLALSLAFGLSSFSSIKKADAAATTTFTLAGTSGTGSGGKIGTIKSGNAYYARGSGSPTADSTGVRLRSTTVMVFSLSEKSIIDNFVVYNPKTSAKDVGFAIYPISDAYYNLIEAAFSSSAKLDATVKTDTTAFSDFSGLSNTQLCTAESVVGSATPTYSYSSSVAAGKANYTIEPENAILTAGKYALFATVDSEIFLASLTLAPAYTYSINSVANPTGEYAIVAGDSIANAGLPTTVEGAVTSDDPNASATVDVPVISWAITSGDASIAGSTLTVTGTLGTVEGYTITAAAPTATVSVKADERVEITAIPDFAGNADLFGTYTLPETITATTANGEVALNVTWDGEVDTSSTGDKTVNGTVTYSNVDYKLANGVDASVTATITVIDNRTVVTSAESVSYTVAQDASLTLPTSVNTSEGVLAVEWDSFDTSATTTVKGSLADSNNYKLAEGVEIVANINVIENNAVSASASWTKGAYGSEWTTAHGTSASEQQELITADVELINSNGIAVIAKSGSARINIQYEYSAAYILIFNSANKLNIELPKGNWTIKIGFSAYNAADRTITIGGKSQTVNAAIPKNQADYSTNNGVEGTWNLTGGSYELTATDKTYIHYINITGSVPSATYTYEEGETLLGADELPLATTGYEFIGWSNDNGATIVDAGEVASAGNYTAIFAKVNVLGTSLRTTENNTGVRFGFDISLLGVENVDDYAKNLVVKFNVFTGKDNNLTATNYALVDGNIRVNAVINNQFDAANDASHAEICNKEITTTITVMFANEQAVSANHTAVISQVAAEALAKEFISAELAAKYGA